MPNAVRNQASVLQRLSSGVEGRPAACGGRGRPGTAAPTRLVRGVVAAALATLLAGPAAGQPATATRPVPDEQATTATPTGQPARTSPAAQQPARAPAAQQPARASQAVAEARRLYNLGRYEAAIAAASDVGSASAARPQALLVLGRSRLERFRQTADEADLAQGRDDLRSIDASRLDARDRLELVVGLGQVLFLENEFRAAAELFTSALDTASTLGGHARDQLLDWWATSLDRHAQTRAAADRPAIYDRLVSQMEHELRRDAGAGSASYWLAAGLRLRGDIERAWDAALAGWVRALMTPDRGAALRPELDALVRDGIAPDRARRATPAGQDVDQTLSAILEEWELFKRKW